MQSDEINLSGLVVGDKVKIEDDLRPGAPARGMAAVYVGQCPIGVRLFQNGQFHDVPFCLFNPHDVEGSLGAGVVHYIQYLESDTYKGEPKREEFPADLSGCITDDEMYAARDAAFNRFWEAKERYWSDHGIQFYWLNHVPQFILSDGTTILGSQCYWSKA